MYELCPTLDAFLLRFEELFAKLDSLEYLPSPLTSNGFFEEYDNLFCLVYKNVKQPFYSDVPKEVNNRVKVIHDEFFKRSRDRNDPHSVSRYIFYCEWKEFVTKVLPL